MNIGRNIGNFTFPTSWLSNLNWIYFQIWLSTVNALYSIWLAVFFFFSFSFFRIPNICFFFFKLLLALIATSFLNVNENFLWFFLCSIFFELLFKTEQKSVVIKCQHLIEYTESNQMLSNVWFLTIEENSFALVNAKKPNKKQKIILNQRMPCSIFTLSKLTPPPP